MKLGRWLVPSALFTLACGAGDAAPPPASSLAIVDGEESGAEQDSVVMLRTIVDDVDVLCSGTLVAPNLVLTARHCVSYLTQGLFACSVRGELLAREEGAGQLGRHLPAEDFEVYDRRTPRAAPLARGQQVLSTLSNTICTNDLAFLVLDRELELPVSPLRLAGAAKVGEPAVLVGYGLNRSGDELDYTRAPRRQRREIQIVGVGPDTVEDVTSVPPRAVILEGPSGCTGDSGGPLLAASTGAVLGVYSLLKGEDCAHRDVAHQLVHVPAFDGLIGDAFTAAGHEPTLEADPSSMTGGGAAGADGGGVPSEAGAGGATVAGTSAGEPASEVPQRSSDEPGSSCAYTPRSSHGTPGILALLTLATLARRRTPQRRPSSGSA